MAKSSINHLKDSVVQIAHGAGGKLQEELIQYITASLKKKKVGKGIGVDEMDDGATILFDDVEWELVVSADGHTIFPLKFPGGDLGKLSVTGTVNDLIMMGAKPLALTSIVLIEEGMKFSAIREIMDSFNSTAALADVAVIAGDTKVMPRGSLKEMIIATTGIGIRPKSRTISDNNCQPGSKIILTGSIGDHGVALLSKREGIELESDLISDVSLLTELLPLIEEFSAIYAMKDPTRGGLAAALNEWASKSGVSIWIKESELIIKPQVKAVCGILGLDPLELANEGKALICIDEKQAEPFLEKLKKTSIGKDAAIIGEVRKDKPGFVIMETKLGGKRIIEMPMGEPIPRIC